MSHPIRVERVASEPGDLGRPMWEAWCRQHPLPGGDTGVVFDSWEMATRHALRHASLAHEPAEADCSGCGGTVCGGCGYCRRSEAHIQSHPEAQP